MVPGVKKNLFYVSSLLDRIISIILNAKEQLDSASQSWI